MKLSLKASFENQLRIPSPTGPKYVVSSPTNHGSWGVLHLGKKTNWIDPNREKYQNFHGGFLKWGYPWSSSIDSRIFPDINHPAIGVPPLLEPFYAADDRTRFSATKGSRRTRPGTWGTCLLLGWTKENMETWAMFKTPVDWWLASSGIILPNILGVRIQQ